MSKRNEQARALHHRAGSATVAVAVDTRHKIVLSRKTYTRKAKHRLRAI